MWSAKYCLIFLWPIISFYDASVAHHEQTVAIQVEEVKGIVSQSQAENSDDGPILFSDIFSQQSSALYARAHTSMRTRTFPYAREGRKPVELLAITSEIERKNNSQIGHSFQGESCQAPDEKNNLSGPGVVISPEREIRIREPDREIVISPEREIRIREPDREVVTQPEREIRIREPDREVVTQPEREVQFLEPDREIVINPERKIRFLEPNQEVEVLPERDYPASDLQPRAEIEDCGACDDGYASLCCYSPRLEFPIMATLEYRGGNGRSYKEGYETVGAFLAIHNSQSRNYSFLDLRVHRVDKTGNFASNYGVGWRMFSPSFEEMLGINVYYDYRRVYQGALQQLGIGVELLGKCWDIRGNGYYPIGKKQLLFETIDFRFAGGYVAERMKYKVPMWGLDVEVGYHLLRTKCLDFYGALGPYFYSSECPCSTLIGAMGRFSMSYKNCLKLQLYATHDKYYHTKGQVDISLNIPLTCMRNFWRCFYVPVERNDILISETICKWKTNY